MRDQHAAILLGFLLMLLPACRKDKDEQGPVIRIITPAEGVVLSIPDTLVVHVEVEDDRQVERVTILLSDVNGVPVTTPISASPGTASSSLLRDLPMDNEALPSGNYTLTVRATDGTNERSAFRTVTVLEAPLRLRAVFLAPPAGSAPATITRIDSVGNSSTWATTADHQGMAVDGLSQHLFVAGSLAAPLLAMPTASTSATWQVTNLNAIGQPYFLGTAVDPVDGRLYFGTNDGFIRGFTGDGAQTFTASTLVGYRSLSTVLVGDRLISAQKAVALPDRYLVGYTRSAGQQLVQFPLDLDVLRMYRRTDQHAVVFGNRSGLGVVQDRNVYQGGVFEMREFSEGPIADVVRINPQTWVLALPDALLRFTYSSNSVTLLAGIPNVTALAHEDATGALYAAQGNAVLVIDPNSGAITGTLQAPGPVGSIAPLLNR